MPDEFVFRWEIEEISKLTVKGRRSPRYYYNDVPWQIRVALETSHRTNNVKSFGYYLYCNDDCDCDLWNIVQVSKLSLIHRSDPKKSIENTIRKPVNKEKEYHWGWPYIIDFTRLLQSSQGFIKGDMIIVEARITVVTAQFIRKRKEDINFSQPAPNADNVVPKLDDGTVNVCRRYLMWHSSYFASLFNGEHKDKDLVELADVKTEEFTELLHVIFPSEKQINADTYQSILILAARFRIEKAIELVERYVIRTENVNGAVKLLLAEKYDLVSLMEYCFNSLDTLRKIKYLENALEFGQFSVTLKVALLQKAFKLME